MLHMPISDVIQKVKEKSGLSEEEIKNQIKLKQKSLEGLVSEEGAAYIIASEMGVKLFKQAEAKTLKIKDILEGMRSVDVVGKVSRLFEPRSYTKQGKTNKVGSFIMKDETGQIRVVIWDLRVDWLTNGKLSEGLVVKVKNAYAKQSNMGGIELHLSTRSHLILDVDEEIDVKEEVEGEIKKLKISELKPNQNARVMGTVVRLFAPRFYNVCPQCAKKVVDADEGFICSEHKKVEPKQAMVFNIILDDSTGNIRCVFFREVADRVSGFTVEEAQEVLDSGGEPALQEQIEHKILGKNIEVVANVRDNRAYDRMELIGNQINPNPNPILIAKKLMEGKK